MKRLLALVVILIVGFAMVNAQTAVKTEAVSNLYKNYSAATAGDTLNTVKTTSEKQYLVGIIISAPVASDTIIVKNGTGTVVNLIEPAAAPFVYYLPIGCHVDTSIVYIQKKTSNATLIYRKTY